MSDEKDLTKDMDQVNEAPEVFDEGINNSIESVEIREISSEEHAIDTSEPEVGINLLGAQVEKALNEKTFSRPAEELEVDDQQSEDLAGSSDEEGPEEEPIEELGEINKEIDEDLAVDKDFEEEIVLNPFERRKNRFKKGTVKWIKEENQIVSENI